MTQLKLQAFVEMVREEFFKILFTLTFPANRANIQYHFEAALSIALIRYNEMLEAQIQQQEKENARS